jgi:hypothetical protein
MFIFFFNPVQEELTFDKETLFRIAEPGFLSNVFIALSHSSTRGAGANLIPFGFEQLRLGT